MAHDLSMKNGEAEMLFTGSRQDIWHGLGFQFDHAPSFEEAMEVVNFPVHKFPLHIALDNGDFLQAPMSYGIYRTDTMKQIGSVGPDYEVVTNGEAFEVVCPLLEQGLVSIDTAGVLAGGRRAWLLCKVNMDKLDPICREVFKDEIKSYILATVGHDGSLSIRYQNVTVRVVCRNTLVVAEAGASGVSSVKHTKNARSKLVDAAMQAWRGIVSGNVTVAEQMQALKSVTLTTEQFKRLVLATAAPDPRKAEGWDPTSRQANATVERWREKCIRVHHLWTKGTGHSGDGSAYEAFNGLVESLDHDREIWRSRSDEGRAVSLTTGPLARIRRKVLADLLEVARG